MIIWIRWQNGKVVDVATGAKSPGDGWSIHDVTLLLEYRTIVFLLAGIVDVARKSEQENVPVEVLRNLLEK